MGLRRVHHSYLDTLLQKSDSAAQNSGKLASWADRKIPQLAEKEGLIGPRCQTCGAPIDREEVVAGMPGRDTFCEVLARCMHGRTGDPQPGKNEELKRFDFGSVEWDERDLMQAMARHRWFMPGAHLEASRIVVPR